MNVWRSSPDLYLPLFSPGCSPTEDQDHHDAPLVALIKTYGLDNERDRLLRFPSPVDEQDADLLLHFASSPLSAKTPASSSSQSTAHTSNSRSSTSDDLDDGDRPPKKRALSPFTPQDFDKAYPLHYLVSPPSVSPVIRTSSPDGDSSNCSPDSVLYLHFKKRRLREISETPRKSLASSFLDDLSPLSSVSSISSISSVSNASSEESPLASRSHSSFVGTRDVTESPLGKMVTSSRVLRASRGSLNRRSLPATRAVGSPAYRRRKLESVPRPYPAPRSQQVAQDMQEKIPLEKKHRLSSQIATETIDSQTTQQVKDSLKIEDSVLEDRGLKLPLRTFPPQVKLHHYFPLFYIRYPIYSCSEEDSKRTGISGASRNEPRSPLDLYTPRFVRGIGASKEGLCPLCAEPISRGGRGKKEWLKTKVSAYKCYHMQYFHGICGRTGRPFSPPIEIRTFSRHPANPTEREQIKRGKCHKCKKWIDVEGIKDVPNKVPELFWWKHAFSCHQGSTMEGETDIFVQDKYYTSALRQSKIKDTESS